MAKIFIDEKLVEAKDGETVFQAAVRAGIHIPHLCYHPAFVPEGSCRMCLVEIEGLPKLELSCSTQVREGMKIFTQSEKVGEARKGTLEFLLAEHPLDCPICDKAGECKLQDYYKEYGLFESQFKEAKEKREKKVRIGENLILDQERCVLCTRCVRFLNEITKTQELGVFERGVRSEINIYENNLVDNNYSNNLTELCPVGAITDTDFRFQTRAWLLEKGESICSLCSRGCNIFIEYNPGFARIPRKKRVYRLKSRENSEVNEYWICDFGRYGYKYLDEERLEKIVQNKNGKQTVLSWEKAYLVLVEKIKALFLRKKISRMAVICHTGLSNEELFLIRKIFGDILQVEKIFIADPPQGEKDNLLLTAERTANRRGAEEIGFDFKPLDLEVIALKTDLLLIFGHFLAESFSLSDIKNALDKIGAKFLFTSHCSSLNDLVDIVLPVALVAEASGSLTNVDGKVQRYSPVLETCGDARALWQVLLSLAKELKINYKYFYPLASSEAILKQMGNEIPFFEKKND